MREQAKNKYRNIVKPKIRHKKFIFFFFAWYKKESKILMFGKERIVKNKFHMRKKSINNNEANIKKIVLSGKESYGN